MDDYHFRYDPITYDLVSIKVLLNEIGFFNDSEINIAISLLEEKLQDKKDSNYQFIFLENEKKIIGYSCYGFIEGTNNSYDLYWIAVDHNFRGKGYGALILEKTEELIKSKSGAHIYIETSSLPLYEPTRIFYKNHGYIKEAIIKDFYKKDDDKLIYSKAL